MMIDGHSVYVRSGFQPKKTYAVFLDRDGVINEERQFAFKLEDLKLIPEIIPALKKLNQQQVPVIVVHNAAAVARNLCQLADVDRFNQRLIRELSKKGVYIDAIFYCPHHRDAFNQQFKQDCDWRKPKPGMFLAAAKKFNLDLTQSYLIGDQERDVAAGEAVGATAFLIKSGQDILAAVAKILL